MRKIIFTLSSILVFASCFSQARRTFGYDGILRNGNSIIRNSAVKLLVSIITESENGAIIYAERQKTQTDSAGIYHIDIGDGAALSGKFDSIIWSDGIFYLRTEFDSLPGINHTITRNILMRIPPDLGKDYEQGTVLSSEFPDHGIWHFRNTRNKRPKLVTVDLTTSYANLAYPANTYPIYRHYEWCDPDLDGTGNAFGISYSDNTTNYFTEHTTSLGDVRLYSKPFQEINISSTNSEIVITITKPIPLKNYAETYAIKGPWKFIYYIEW